jgi:preprotein translocase subunit SecE
MTRISPVSYLRQVRQEVSKITWPSRKETVLSTAMVFVMVIFMALFFFVADQVIGLGVRAILGLGG